MDLRCKGAAALERFIEAVVDRGLAVAVWGRAE